MIKCYLFSSQVPGSHVLHLWHSVCLRLFFCLPAQPGHPGPLLQEAPWPGEWHRYCWQQHLHHHPALFAVRPSGKSGPPKHHARPLHPYVCADASRLHLQAPAASQILKHQHGQPLPTHESDLQHQYLEVFGIPHLGLWYPCSPLWLLCALCSPGKFLFLPISSLICTHTTTFLCLVYFAGYHHPSLWAKGQSDDE